MSQPARTGGREAVAPATATRATPEPAGALGDSHRIEAFSDAVFGFAATLLVVTLEVPRTFPQLAESLWGFVPFAFSFLALSLLWTTHRAYFRRYRIADRTTIGLNSILLFVILFYVYPLKFMTVALIEEVLSRRPFSESRMFRGEQDVAGMFVVYGMGFAAVFACYALMYRHAGRSAGALALTPDSRREAWMLCRHYWILCSVGLLSTVMALLGVGVRFGAPGWIYGAIGPLTWAHGVWSGRRARREPGSPAEPAAG
jgi:uncharacterized membrane protein